MTKEPRGLAANVGLVLGPAVFLLFLLVPSDLHTIEGLGSRPAAAAGVAAWMAVWWLTEAVPMELTSLLPVAMWPLVGVYGKGPAGDLLTTLGAFVDAYLFLFLGGMVLGAGMEEQGLHRRIALHVLNALGTEPRRLLLGVLVATAGISMWISNTATAVMMMPIAIALVKRLEAQADKRLPAYGCAMLLGIAWAANLGGIGTKIGTGTNSIFCGFLVDRMGIDLGFLQYMAMATPFVVLFLPLLWFTLWRIGRADAVHLGPLSIREDLAGLGPMSGAERTVAVLFGSAAVLWILGDQLKLVVGPLVPEVWEGFRFQGKHWEAGVAMTAAALCWLLGGVSLRGIAAIPFGVLLLLGGSFAMAAGIDGSGLSRWMASNLSALGEAPLVAQVGVATAVTVALSAVASNTATINVLLNVLPRSLPVLASASIGASCDFALPAGTPPNAIVFGSGYVRLPTMIRYGATMDLAAIVAITLYGSTWIAWLLG
jgi:solute carrier family 13 (sodium-dependent dicarboxylate transporter), member 2/3/5